MRATSGARSVRRSADPGRSVRRAALLIPLVIVAYGLPVVRPAIKPHIRHWALSFASNRPLKAPGVFGLAGVSWPATSKPPKAVQIRAKTERGAWDRWTTVDFEPDVAPDHNRAPRRSTEPVWVGKKTSVEVRFIGPRPAGAKLELIDPGPDPSVPTNAAMASPSQPGIISRAQWGADESMRRDDPDYAEPIQLAVVHHTATADSYSKSESDDIVRGIYAYHVNSNGWDDIGYNFLIDRYGQIFEGRYGGITRAVVGAHAQGFNSHSTGISIIGTFSGSKPPEVTMQSIKTLVSWRLDQATVDPRGSLVYTSNGSNRWPEGTKVSLKVVSAHRDTGQTTCPGDAIYNSLAWLREAAALDHLPKLFNAKASNPVITPNADGVADGTRLTGTLSSARSWKADVINSSGSVLKSVSGFGTSINLPWYGKDANNNVVTHGEYRFRVTGTGLRTYYVPFSVFRWADGTPFLAKPSGKTYVLMKGALRHFSSWQSRSSRYGSVEYVNVGDNITKGYKVGSNIGFRDGAVVSVDGKVYVISDGKRRPTTTTTLSKLHYDLDSIIKTDATSVAPNPVGSTFSSTTTYPNGATIKSSTGQQGWVLSGTAKPFFTTNARKSWYIRDVDLAGPADATMEAGSMNDPLGYRDGTLVRLANGTTTYMISNGQRRAFTSSAEFRRMGFKTDNIKTVTATELALHPQGASL